MFSVRLPTQLFVGQAFDNIRALALVVVVIPAKDNQAWYSEVSHFTSNVISYDVHVIYKKSNSA